MALAVGQARGVSLINRWLSSVVLLCLLILCGASSADDDKPGASQLLIKGEHANLLLRAPIDAKPAIEPRPGDVGENRIHTRHRLIASLSEPRAVLFFDGELIELEHVKHGGHLPPLEKLATFVIKQAGFDPAAAKPVSLPSVPQRSGETVGYRITTQKPNPLFVGQIVYYIAVTVMPDKHAAYAVSLQLTTDEDNMRKHGNVLEEIARSNFDAVLQSSKLIANP